MAVNKSLTSERAGTPTPTQIKAAEELARRKIYVGIPDDDVALALAICQKYGFDPLLQHLVLIAGNSKDNTTGQWVKSYKAYVTRNGLLHVAHASGQLDGLEVKMGKDELGEWAEAVVYRKDMNRPFCYRVYLSEYARVPIGAWKTHPRAMLTKTAEVFALRRAFDVALTPVEEMGFENRAGFPNWESGSQGGPERTKKHEWAKYDLPTDQPQESPLEVEQPVSKLAVTSASIAGSKRNVGSADTGGTSNGRRRLF